MNKNIIIEPNFIHSIPVKYSSDKLNILLKEDNQLEYLRSAYIKDTNVFYNLRDELIMRGYGFDTSIQNNIFPKEQFQPKNIIMCVNNTSYINSKKINVLGLDMLINRYNIKSDLFFNGIPLEGLKWILHLEDNDDNLLKSQLNELNFHILPITEINNLGQLSSSGMQENIELKNLKEYSKDTIEGKESSIYVDNRIPAEITTSDLKMALDAQDHYINSYFIHNKFNMFRIYCHANKKIKTSDLTIDFIREFRKEKGVGTNKYLDVKNQFKKLLNENKENKNKSKNTINQEKIHFYQNNPLREFLSICGLDYLSFVDDLYSYAENESLYSEISKDKFEQLSKMLLSVVESYKKEKLNQLRNEIIQLPAYKLVEALPFSEVMRLFRIELDNKKNDLPNRHKNNSIDDYILKDMVDDERLTNEIIIVKEKLEEIVPINLTLQKLYRTMDDRGRYIIEARLTRTLQEVGVELNITRERIRQIEAKIDKKITFIISSLHLEVYLKYTMRNVFGVNLDSFVEELKIDNVLIPILKKAIALDDSLKIVGKFVSTKILYDFNEKKLEEINNSKQKIFFENELMEIYNKETLIEVELRDLQSFMNVLGFKNRENIYYKNNLTHEDRLEFLFKNIIKEPLFLNEEGYEYLQSLLKMYFDTQFNKQRNLVAAIDRFENIIPIDYRTYTFFDIESVNLNFINELEIIIERLFYTSATVFPRAIYEKSPQLMIENNIMSSRHLYYVVKYFFSDQYNVGNKNTFRIFKNKNRSMTVTTNEERLVQYLEKNGLVVPKDKILKDLSWKDYQLESTFSNSNKFIKTSNGIRLVRSYQFSDSDLEKIISYKERFIKEGYLFTHDLLTELEFDSEMNKILIKYDINDDYTFTSILKFLDPSLRGYEQLLFKKDSEFTTTESIIAKDFRGRVYRDELIEFLENKNYAGSTINFILNKIVENKQFYQYTTYSFINNRDVNFNDEVKIELNEYLKNQLMNNKYISAIDLTEFSNINRVSSFDWTPQLIFSLADDLGYIQISNTNDFRYKKWILVDPSLNIHKYDELVYYILKNEYRGRMHESDIATFLQEKNIIHEKIGYEIQKSEYFYFKELGFIDLKEI